MTTLEQAAEDCQEQMAQENPNSSWDCADVRNAFKAGAEWMEKQKPVEWSEEDEAMRDNILRLLSCFVGTLECDSNPSLSTSYLVYQREIDWLKSLRPQPKK